MTHVHLLGIFSSERRNGRAREAWVRSAAAALQRMSAAAVACAEVLEATAQASKHLAHQVIVLQAAGRRVVGYVGGCGQRELLNWFH